VERWLPALAIAVALAGTVARFVTVSGLWLDEALSVNIASLPLGDIPEALRHDGHPPLYYFLLHGWIERFGDDAVAVRALSGIIATLTLPVAWVAGRRAGRRAGDGAGGSTLGWLTVLVLGALPFAARYGTEARMYSLVILLVFLGWIVVDEALQRPRLWALAGVGLVTGVLLLTHYWSFYLVAAVGLLLALRAWRSTGEARTAAVRTMVAMAAGGVLFLPWLPSFLEQAAHTGTPWATPERPTKVLALLFADLGGVDNAERILFTIVLGLLLTLALFGRTVDRLTIELDLRTRPEARRELAVTFLTLGVAVVAGYVTSSAFAPRYLAMVVPLVVLAAAWGLARVPDVAPRLVVLGAFLLTCAFGIVDVVGHERTQLDRIAAAIDDGAEPGDLVVYCPDQLGPAGDRALDTDLDQVTYPELGSPRFVDWVDYAERNEAADPEEFVDEVLERAGEGAIWLAWSGEYVTFEGQCEQVRSGLARARPRAGTLVSADSGQFFENANLQRFAAP
jgi:uncharacterized membrane protein